MAIDFQPFPDNTCQSFYGWVYLLIIYALVQYIIRHCEVQRGSTAAGNPAHKLVNIDLQYKFTVQYNSSSAFPIPTGQATIHTNTRVWLRSTPWSQYA